MDDTDLTAALEAARSGDEEAAAILFIALNPPLLRYLRHHVSGVAEDLAAEVWLGVIGGLAGFRGDLAGFRAWMFSIARRRVADHYDSLERRPRLVELDGSEEIPERLDAAEPVMAAMAAQDAVEALVRALPPDQAEVVLLRVLGDLSVKEVAELMGRSPGSVRVLQHRALKRLAVRWEHGVVTR